MDVDLATKIILLTVMQMLCLLLPKITSGVPSSMEVLLFLILWEEDHGMHQGAEGASRLLLPLMLQGSMVRQLLSSKEPIGVLHQMMSVMAKTTLILPFQDLISKEHLNMTPVTWLSQENQH